MKTHCMQAALSPMRFHEEEISTSLFTTNEFFFRGFVIGISSGLLSASCMDDQLYIEVGDDLACEGLGYIGRSESLHVNSQSDNRSKI